MKLNKTRLKQLIQEELQAALSEETQEEFARRAFVEAGDRKLVADIVKNMGAYDRIINLMSDLAPIFKDKAKLQELTGVTEQDLKKVIALNQKIQNELRDIYTQMARVVAANQRGTTPSRYGKTDKTYKSPF